MKDLYFNSSALSMAYFRFAMPICIPYFDVCLISYFRINLLCFLLYKLWTKYAYGMSKFTCISMSLLFRFVILTFCHLPKCLYSFYYLATKLVKTIRPDFNSCTLVLLGNRTTTYWSAQASRSSGALDLCPCIVL